MRQPLSFQRLLLLFIAFIALLITVRIYYSGNFEYIFLAWNIFLAWIPLLISNYFIRAGRESVWKQVLLFLLWFLFFPNSLYIVTDLIHLEMDANVPKWFDAILLFTSSLIGLIMAFVSLFRLENYLLTIFDRKLVGKLILLILFFGSFGVYLGRFLRWNSWDIIRHPFGLITSIAARMLFPISFLRTWEITSLFAVLFYLLYLTIKKIPGHMNRE